MSRLTDAVYKVYVSNDWQQSSNFNEKIKGYDLNGNIKGIERRGSYSNWNVGLIDNLTYYYSGNQLFAVDDDPILQDNGYDFFDNGNFSKGTTHEYLYDANGNLKKDANKEIIEIKYNFLNLPSEVNFTGNNKISYLYDANGTKLRQDVIKANIISKRTDFISNFVIINNAPAWINFDEGRVIMDGTAVHFTETHLKDHLGNTRVVFGYKNNTLLVKQVSSYYPFGMNIKGLTTQVTIEEAKHPTNEYLYNGKMFQDELGLDWLDYGARMYDAVLGRFPSIDPIIENWPNHTPYNYAFSNPSTLIDLYGLQGVNPNTQFSWMANPTVVFQEGFRQIFDAGLTAASIVVGAVKEFRDNLVTTQTGNVTYSKDIVKVVGFEAKADFSKVLDLNSSNTPNPPEIRIEFIDDSKIRNSATAHGVIQGFPVSLSLTNEQNVNGDNSNSVKLRAGIDNANVYVKESNTTKSDGSSKSNIAIGAEVATPPFKLDEKSSFKFKAYGELRLNTGK
ncbi:MAG: RHS repeat-associated core [Bacteroidetes bacterium]|nr:MAG: RHS repeat-associated core [Bacteroidota bacterium]